MRSEDAFEIWAPEGAVWSPWAKPVLFVRGSEHAVIGGDGLASSGSDPSVMDVSWAPDAAHRTALVLELPGLTSVEIALSLVDKGYRPVPLFNSSIGKSAVVPVEPLRDALFAACVRLSHANLHADSPPAFLLDRGRLGVDVPVPGKFDNRWMVFSQDFPSGNFLLSQRVESVVLVTEKGKAVVDDLAHVLYRWKEAGLSLARKDFDGGPITPLDVSRPRGFRTAWYRALVVLGLKRNSAGGFGSVVPTPSGGGGGGFM